jgi:integrase
VNHPPPLFLHQRQGTLAITLRILALLVLDATGVRVGELEAAKIGDLDETRPAWLVRAAVAKTRRARWVPLPEDLYQAVLDRLPAREDRDADAQLFPGVTADRLRIAIGRACRDSGTPHFSRTRSGIGGSHCCIGTASPGPRSATSWGSGRGSSRPTLTAMR